MGAAKSTGLFNDQLVIKWPRKVKKVSQEQQAIWAKLGKSLPGLFVEQFKKYKELHVYLNKEIPLEEAEEWKSILNAQEYIWPIAPGKGWENVFNPVPSLCEKISATKKGKHTNVANIDKRKIENKDNNNERKRQKLESVSDDTSKTSIPGIDVSEDKDDEKRKTE